MSEWTVHLEFEEGTSSKFWRARVEGKTLYVNYGKIGAAGQTQVKDFADAGAATKEYDKLVKEKQKKGYVAPGEGGGGGDDADEGGGDDEDQDDEGEDEAPPPRARATPPPPPQPAAARPRPPGHRMVLDAGNRKVEAHVSLDGATVRLESLETYGSPEAAKKALDRLKRALAGEGYKDG